MSTRYNPLTTHQYAGIAANMTIKTVDSYQFDSFDACHRFADTHKMVVEGEWNIASNVRLRSVPEEDGLSIAYYAIVLYKTEIVRYYDDRQTFSVDNGGHNTPTTSERVTQFTPAGYAAHHSQKRLVLNAHATGHEHRFPVSKVSY